MSLLITLLIREAPLSVFQTVPTGRDRFFDSFQALRARLPSFSPYGTKTPTPFPTRELKI
jgi:hypothetical protein